MQRCWLIYGTSAPPTSKNDYECAKQRFLTRTIASSSLRVPRYYTTFVVRSARLIYKDSSLSEYILGRCWRLVQPYWPTIFATDPHTQIALASAASSPVLVCCTFVNEKFRC